ncbi:MAG: tRNA pseudouridine(38-40) synthase TruA [Phycisphaerae bacterium]|nr:tRNA pseudouridine(38-40) synthase TruA [Phycisphaerae bacterium]
MLCRSPSYSSLHTVRNIKLIIAYDGSNYHGWQIQSADLPTVQGLLKSAIQRVVRHPIILHGTSRTDAGVHAVGQVANFQTDCQIPADRIRLAVNSRCPADITIRYACEVPEDFHAGFSAKSKLYRYRIYNASGRPVELVNKCYHYWRQLDVAKMSQAADVLLGRHDFAAFASSSDRRATTERELFRCEVYRHAHEVIIEIEGDGFLYNMVRNIVGTLLEIGRGHWPVERIAEILASRDRQQAGPTAPSAGLTLIWVKY